MKWRYSYYELIKKIEMKMGEVQATQICLFTSVAEVVSSAFGSKKGQSPAKGPITEDLTKLDPQAYQARVTQLFSGRI